MKISGKNFSLETKIYITVWACIFAFPVIHLTYHIVSGHDSVSAYGELPRMWLGLANYLALFVVHGLLLRLLPKRKELYYALLCVLLVLCAVLVLNNTDIPPGPGPEGGPGPGPYLAGEHLHEVRPGNLRPLNPAWLKLIICILMILTQIGIKSIFRTLANEKRLRELENASLKNQLESLRYQINPHFFMNTLNNIHALVDIDSERAKESIMKFSKMMRLLLYEGDSPTIPLAQELDLIQNYISLMRLRFPDSVKIESLFPDDAGSAEVPPLLMVSTIENAFKHGISYEQESIIRTWIKIEGGKIHFSCFNKKFRHNKSGGIGLENLHRQLELLYGSDYSLEILDNEDSYEILLTIPARPSDKAFAQ